MKSIGRFITAACIIAFGGIAVGKHFWRGETMTVSQAEKIWGKSEFNAELFRTGDSKTRAKMVGSLISSKWFLGKSVETIRKELGDWDGYYFSDMFPAYIVQDGRVEKGGTWQIVFLLDRDHKANEVIIHKN